VGQTQAHVQGSPLITRARVGVCVCVCVGGGVQGMLLTCVKIDDVYTRGRGDTESGGSSIARQGRSRVSHKL
jgi:predicted DNA repair protein MutK